jgi:hypothetical protein
MPPVAITVVVAELGACSAKVVTITELASITVAADANANAKVLSASYGRCRNRNSREGCKRKTKLSHVPSSFSCPRENGGTESLFLRSGSVFLDRHFVGGKGQSQLRRRYPREKEVRIGFAICVSFNYEAPARIRNRRQKMPIIKTAVPIQMKVAAFFSAAAGPLFILAPPSQASYVVSHVNI